MAEEYKARYKGLLGIARMLMQSLGADDEGGLPKTKRQRAISAGNPTHGRYDNGNREAVRAEIDPNFMQSRPRARVRTAGKNRYVTGMETEDESLDSSSRYPLHRLSRQATRRSESARHNAQELRRIERLFGGR